MEKINKQVMEEQNSDFETQAVPLDKRKSFFSITIVWTGFVFLITSMMAGGGLAKGLSLKEIIIATLSGNIFLSILSIAICIIASKTGLSFALITRYSFGHKGSKIATLFVPIVNIGWYTVQSAIYGHFIASILGIDGIWELVLMFVSAIVMGIFALIGMEALTVLGYVAIPAIIYLSLGAAIKATNMGGVEHLINYVPQISIDMTEGMGIVIGTWILSTATCIADIMRFAKSIKEAVISTVFGLVLGNSLLIICGAVAAIGSNQSDLCVMLLSMGLVIPSFVLMTTNIFTTSAANIYSTSLNLSNSFNMDRKKLILIILVISGLLTFTKPNEIDNLFIFLDTLGKIVPPLAGIIISDYYVVNKGKYTSLEEAKKCSFNLSPWITWAITLFFVFNIKWGLPALNGIVISMILYVIISFIFKGFRKKVEVV